MSNNITGTNARNPSGDGKTWLIDLLTAGVTGSGYGPASGITNVTLKMTIPGVVATACAQASATISGSVLAITTLAAVPSSTLVSSVTFSIGSGSNLTDGSANTAQGQTDVAATNGSTVAAQYFALSNAAYLLSGQWQDASQASHNAKQLVGNDSTVDVQITGTGCALVGSTNGQAAVSVDGAAFATLYNSSFAWVAMPAAEGLSDAAHTVRLRGGNSFSLDRDLGLIVYGAAPAVAQRTDMAAQTTLAGAAFAAVGRCEGGIASGSNAGYTARYATSYNDGGIRFRASAAAIHLWAYSGNCKWRLYRRVAGVWVSLSLTSDGNTGKWGWLSLATGLDTGESEFLIRGVNGAQGYQANALMLVGGAGLSATPVSAYPSAICFYGDSIPKDDATGDSTDGFVSKVCFRLDRLPINRGWGGSTVKQFAGGAPNAPATTTLAGEARTAVPIADAAAQLVMLYGSNDMAQQGGAETAADYQISETNTLGQLKVGLPSAKKYILGLLPRVGFTLASWNAAVQAAVTATADPNSRYVDTTGWITTADTSDGIHPTAVGYDKIVNRLLPLLADAWGMITGPTTGTPGVATSPYTVTLASGATFTGDQTVTLSVANGTITATAAGGSVSANGTGTVTVTPAAGATSFTYTRTPATAGSDPTVATNGQGWAAPAPAAFTATAAASANRRPALPDLVLEPAFFLLPVRP